MSKYVKNLITDDLKRRWEGVNDALLVDVTGVGANATVALRRELREKGCELVVVKNSLARRAAEGTSLSPAFAGIDGALAVVWGAEDLVSLAKEVVRISKDDAYAPFAPAGGVMDGKQLSPEDVTEVSKWPNREVMLSILSGQLLSPGATLSAQLLGPGGLLASQIEQKGDEE